MEENRNVRDSAQTNNLVRNPKTAGRRSARRHRFPPPAIALGVFGLAVGLLAGLNVLISGVPATEPIVGVVDDWSHHHLVFSNPGTAADALAHGRFEEWYRAVNDPRYLMQQMKRDPTQRAMQTAPDFAARRALMRQFPTYPEAPHRPRRVPEEVLSKDWNVNLGAGATVGSGNYPAKFSFNSTPACGDIAVFNTSLAGSATQATVEAITNLYSTCNGGVETVAWAYNTTSGDVAGTSVVLAPTGKQAAFISTAGGHAFLNVLQFASGQGTAYNTPAAPAVLTTTGAAYSTCKTTTPNGTCLLRLAFGNAATDTTSSPFYDYSGTDTLWVGDGTGNVHKFTGVFNGSPAESGNPWVSVGVSTALASPVYDGTSTVYVGGANGILYRISSTPAVTASATLAGGKGITDGALVDPIAGEVYIFVGTDTEATTHPGLIRLPTGFAAGATASEIALTQAGVNVPEYAGSFDNIYYTNDASATTKGSLFACFEDQNADYLLQFPVANFPTPTGISTTYGSYYQVTSASTGCSPVTEILSGGTDWVFLSVATDASYITGGASTCTAALGCLYNFNLGNGTTLSFTDTTTPTAGFPIAAGTATVSSTSGIVVDYTASPGNNIYFTTNATGTGSPCTPTTQGCAIQVTQAAP
jgi:hypothetical protein